MVPVFHDMKPRGEAQGEEEKRMWKKNSYLTKNNDLCSIRIVKCYMQNKWYL